MHCKRQIFHYSQCQFDVILLCDLLIILLIVSHPPLLNNSTMSQLYVIYYSMPLLHVLYYNVLFLLPYYKVLFLLPALLLHVQYYNVLFLLPVLLPHVQFYYCTISSTCPISGGKACRESPASTTPHALFVPSRAAS